MAEPLRRGALEPPSPGDGTLVGTGPELPAPRRADGSFVVAFGGGGSRSEGARGPVEEDPRGRRPSGRRRDYPGTCPAGAASHDAYGTSGGAGFPYSLITRRRPEGTQVLAIGGVAGEPALPVFSLHEGAREFLRSYAREGGWEATPTGIGGLLSLLHGSCAEAGCVALDPSPEIVAVGATGLVSLPRQSFVDSLLGRGRAWFEDRNREEGQTHE